MCTAVASGQKGRFLQNACPAGVSKTTIFFLTTTRSHFPPIRREKEKSEINEVGSRISRLWGEKGGKKCDQEIRLVGGEDSHYGNLWTDVSGYISWDQDASA